MKKLLLFSCLTLALGLSSCESSDEGVMTIELESPKPEVTTKGLSAEISWPAIAKTAGYAYKLDNTAEWTNVAADIRSVTFTELTPGDHTFHLYAVGDNNHTTDSAVRSIDFYADPNDTSEGVYISMGAGGVVKLEEVAADIYEGSASFSGKDSFSILIDNIEYGFASYSGNGGVGTVSNANACVPTEGINFYVRESIGQMVAKESNFNKFWIEVAGATCTVKVRIDRSYEDEIPRYHLQLVEQPDPSVLLAQYFDLMSYGGNWLDGKVGRKGEDTSATSIDGTEPAAPKTVTAATLGVTIASDATARPEYIANRGLSGWGIENCFEFAGLLRLSSPGNGVLTTPKMEGMTAAGTITLTFDAVAFGGTTDMITVKVLNAGTISSANVKIKGAATATNITPESGNTSFIITKVHCPKYANTDAKAYSNFTVVIENATADTQICWDTTAITTLSNARLCLDNIIVKKN